MSRNSGDAPDQWAFVEKKEHLFIRGQRASAAAASAAAQAPLPAERITDLVGLSFSGGGIRSATFNLGVLQALAKLGLLDKIDYLSTVSGGGYIGGWFQAWLYRTYYELRIRLLEDIDHEEGHSEKPASREDQCLERRIEVLEFRHRGRGSAARDLFSRISEPAQSQSIDERLRELEHLRATQIATRPNSSLSWMARQALLEVQSQIACGACSAESGGQEPAPIKFLRDYSNYLTPKTGVFSADTWTLVVIYLRNLLLNALVLTLSGCAVLLGVRGLAKLHRIMELFLAASWQGALAFGFCALLTAVYGMHCGLSVLGKAEERQKHRSYVFQNVVVPMLIVSFVLSMLLARFAKMHQDFWTYAPWFVGAVPLIGLISWSISSRRDAILRVTAGRAGKWLPLVALIASLTAGALGAWLMLELARMLASTEDFVARVCRDEDSGVGRSLLGAPLVLCIFACTLAAQIGVMGRGTTEYVREWSSRLMAHLLLWSALCFGIGSIALFGAELWGEVQEMGHLADGLTLGWVVSTVSGLLAARGSERDNMPLVRSALITVTPHVFTVGALIGLSILSLRIDDQLNTFWLSTHWSAQIGAALNVEVAEHVSRTFVVLSAALVAGAAALFLSWRLGVNEFSLHTLYRNRLIRCYLGAVRGDERQADVFTGFDLEDDGVRVDELGTHVPAARIQTAMRPYHLVNATLNLVVGQRLAWQFRRASSFVFSPFYSGYETRSPALETSAVARAGLYNWGYRNTREYGGGISLGTAMAISGAALSPNMGARTTPAMAFLMTLFNVRLGWWLGNPRHEETWRKSGPDAGLVHLMIELLGRATDSRKYVYLSDGGHFENLGLYELVRRRCRYIVVSDAGEDGALEFGDLGNAIEKCRVDFGVEIEIDVGMLQRDPTTGNSKSHCAIGRIRYDRLEDGGDTGTLVYLKSTLVGSEPVDIRTYAKANPRFPHQSTTDQWFDETQFESYRALGEHVAVAALARDARELSEGSSAEPLFHRLRQRHLAPAPGADHAFAKHCEALSRLYEELRSNTRLSFLDAQFYPEWDTLRAQALTRHDFVRRDRESLLPARSVEEIPATEEQLRAGFYFCQELIQLMEAVYTDLNLEANHAHPDNRGWMNLFFHWAWSGTFRLTWAVIGSTTGVRFQSFSELKFGLTAGLAGKRVGSISVRLTDRAPLESLPGAAVLSELALSQRERELLAKIASGEQKQSAEAIWRCFSAELQVAERRSECRKLSFPVAFGVLRDDTLVFLRTRDHQRKSGLARDVVINLAQRGYARGCKWFSCSELTEGASELELRRYQHTYADLIRANLAPAPPGAKRGEPAAPVGE